MDIMFVLVGIVVFCGLAGVVGAMHKERESDPLAESCERRTSPWRSDKDRTEPHSPLRGVRPLRLALLLACAATLAGAANGQEVIHAAYGTIVDANATTNDFSVRAWDGPIVDFHAASKSAKPVTFEKNLRAQTVAATGEHLKGTKVLVFYYGYGNVRTAVAIKDVGQEDVGKVNGAVEKYDRHNHELTIAGQGSSPTLLALTAQTVVDTPDGVVEGNKFHADKGEQINAVFAKDAGTNSAVLIDATGYNGR
jgi:hypothetical protein